MTYNQFAGDFYVEEVRDPEDTWTGNYERLIEVGNHLDNGNVPYRMYYSKDDLRCRLFLNRHHSNQVEREFLLGLGFTEVTSKADYEVSNGINARR
jgi:hypothetical protein